MRLCLILLLLTVNTACASLPKLEFTSKSREIKPVSLQDRIESRMRFTGKTQAYNQKTYIFFDRNQVPGLTFVKSMFGKPIPWFSFKEEPAIDLFIRIVTQEMRPGTLIMLSSPRIEAVVWEGKDCMVIVADICFAKRHHIPDKK